MVITPGTWSIGGFKLPDLGITEKLGIATNPNRSMTFPVSTNSQGQIQGVSTQAFTTPQPQKINPGTVSSNIGSQNLNVPSSVNNNPQQYVDQVNNNANQDLSFIEQDYNNAIGYLGGQESGLRSQADTASQDINNQYADVTAQLGQQQGVAEQGVTAQQQTGETQAKSAMQQARDIFRQTQQSNIAQLSALGISSSSVQEALAERLGVETARRIAGVTDSLSTIRQNAVQEMGRIKNYYESQKTNLEKTKATEQSKIQQNLMAGLNQINYARNQAATDKARARQGILQEAAAQVASLNQQAQAFNQSLAAWASQKTAALNNFVTDPNYLDSYQKNINTLNAQPGITQSYIGNYGVNSNGDFGYYTGPLKSVKKDPNDLTDITG